MSSLQQDGIINKGINPEETCESEVATLGMVFLYCGFRCRNQSFRDRRDEIDNSHPMVWNTFTYKINACNVPGKSSRVKNKIF